MEGFQSSKFSVEDNEQCDSSVFHKKQFTVWRHSFEVFILFSAVFFLFLTVALKVIALLFDTLNVFYGI